MNKRVLTWVNTQRSRAGLPTLAEMPKGMQHSPEDCPMTRAWFDAFVEEGEQLVSYPGGLEIIDSEEQGWNTLRKIKVPKYVGAAIMRFDNGKYPELIA